MADDKTVSLFVMLLIVISQSTVSNCCAKAYIAVPQPFIRAPTANTKDFVYAWWTLCDKNIQIE